MLMFGVLLRKEITCKFRLADPKFDGYLDFRVFSDWLADMECHFNCYKMFVVRKIRFVRVRLLGLSKIYWTSIEIM